MSQYDGMDWQDRIRLMEKEGKFAYEQFDDIEFFPIPNDSDEWDLYIPKENKEPLGSLIAATVLLFFVKGGWLVLLCLWVLYFYWCINNYKKLDNDPMVIAKRREYKYHRMNDPKDPDHPLYKTKYYINHPHLTPNGEKPWLTREQVQQRMENKRYKEL